VPAFCFSVDPKTQDRIRGLHPLDASLRLRLPEAVPISVTGLRGTQWGRMSHD
jgi:hypothetical protein